MNRYLPMVGYSIGVAIGNVTTSQVFGKGFAPSGVAWAYIMAMACWATLDWLYTAAYAAATGEPFRMPWTAYEIQVIFIIGACYYFAEKMLTYSLTVGALSPFEVTTIGCTAIPILTVIVGLVWKYVFQLETPVSIVPSTQNILALGLGIAFVAAVLWEPEYTDKLRIRELGLFLTNRVNWTAVLVSLALIALAWEHLLKGGGTLRAMPSLQNMLAVGLTITLFGVLLYKPAAALKQGQTLQAMQERVGAQSQPAGIFEATVEVSPEPIEGEAR